MSWSQPALAASACWLCQALDGLVRAAQRAGGVRRDVGVDGVLALAAGCAAVQAAHRGRTGGARVVWLVLEGLWSPQAVTPGWGFRDSARVADAELRCADCGARLRARSAGRLARCCGPGGRRRAHRRRRRRAVPSRASTGPGAPAPP
ncbi:hypothetical protein [Streptomyces synnematoformans]|uniref:SbtR family transcriptional regulator n=1 Tax=Streptomyces synnematoformans TaxID=415721 RepID=UPI003CD09D28